MYDAPPLSGILHCLNAVWLITTVPCLVPFYSHCITSMESLHCFRARYSRTTHRVLLLWSLSNWSYVFKQFLPMSWHSYCFDFIFYHWKILSFNDRFTLNRLLGPHLFVPSQTFRIFVHMFSFCAPLLPVYLHSQSKGSRNASYQYKFQPALGILGSYFTGTHSPSGHIDHT